MVDLQIKLPEGFLEEEVRCDYLVSSQMKKVWAVELDLLVEFQRVADKYGIKYVANGGTMLGAVRHKGFIPWDDDIDIAMMRSDFEKICKVAEYEFKKPYFWQTEYTDPGSLRCHAQLRNSETTAILSSEVSGDMTFNQGIFIDIFPFDAVPDDSAVWEKECKIAQKYFDRMCDFANISVHYVKDRKQPKFFVKTILHFFFSPIFAFLSHFYFEKYEKECIKYDLIKTKYIAMLCWGYKYKQLFRPRKDYESTIMADFEFIKVPICRDYDKVLTDDYGDWRQFIVGTSMHKNIIFDVDRSYRDYLSSK